MNGALRLSVVLLLAAGGGWWWWSAHRTPARPPVRSEVPVVVDLGPYVGVAGCRGCHAKETDAWEASPHGRHALPRAKPRSPTAASIGSVWMQTFLARDAQGYHRILPRCFDLRENRWRAVRAVLDEIRGPRDDVPTITDGQIKKRSFEFDCAGCHAVGTHLRVNGETGHMRSSWRDLAIDCEACHGPGRAHAEAWTNVDPSKPLVAIGTLPARHQTALCARCHGGPPTMGRYGPAEAADFVGRLDRGAGVRADGSAIGQLYQHAAFSRSPCGIEGELTCTDCHDPHGPGLRQTAHIDGLCTTCHEEHGGRRHHHHDPSKPGGRCVDCHMPRIFEGLLAHQRDHRIGIPLPATPYAPDACTACHEGRSKNWAAGAAARWWGPPDRATLDAIDAVARGRLGDASAHTALEAAREHSDPHLRMAAARFLKDAASAAADQVPEVRLTAVPLARDLRDKPLLFDLAQDPEVRVRAAAWVALDLLGAAVPPAAAEDLRRAARQLRDATPLRRLLARLDLAAGRAAEAAETLADAVSLHPTDISLWRALADAWSQAGDNARAEEARARVDRLTQQEESPRR